MGDMDKFHGLVVFVAARSLLGVFSVDGEDGRKTAPAGRRSIYCICKQAQRHQELSANFI